MATKKVIKAWWESLENTERSNALIRSSIGLKYRSKTLSTPFTLVSDLYQQLLPYKCKVEVCGRISPECDPNGFVEGAIKNKMVELGCCHTCAFWLIKKEEFSSKNFIIRGHHYTDCGKVDRKKVKGFLGHGGRNFKIELFNGEVIETNNLWAQGDVPKYFRDILPDNAKFI